MRARKWRSVIAPDCARHSMSLEEPLKARLHRLRLCIRHSSHFQHIAGVFVTDCHRITPPMPVVPPPLEVHRPYLVRCARFSPAGQPSGFIRAPRLALLGEPTSLQHSLEAALARRLSPMPQIHCPDLPRPPVPMPLL